MVEGIVDEWVSASTRDARVALLPVRGRAFLSHLETSRGDIFKHNDIAASIRYAQEEILPIEGRRVAHSVCIPIMR